MHRLGFIAFLAVAAGGASCGRCGSAGGKISAEDAPAADAPAQDLAKQAVVWKDAAGNLLPSDELPFGTPVPRKMKKIAGGKTWCRYEGTWKLEEVLAFYRTYLTLPAGTFLEESGRGFVFNGAHPVAPGNTGRTVKVTVIDEADRGRTAVVIFDLSGLDRKKDWDAVPPYDPKTWKPSKPGEFPPENLM